MEEGRGAERAGGGLEGPRRALGPQEAVWGAEWWRTRGQEPRGCLRVAVGLRGVHAPTRAHGIGKDRPEGTVGGGVGPWRQSAQETKAKRRKPKDRGAVRGARAAGARPREGVGCWAQHPQPVPRPERQRGRGGQGSPKIQRAEKAGGQGRPWAGPADLPAAELAAQGRFRSPAAEDAMAPAPMPAPSTPTPTCGNTSYGRSPGRARGGPGAAGSGPQVPARRLTRREAVCATQHR